MEDDDDEKRIDGRFDCQGEKEGPDLEDKGQVEEEGHGEEREEGLLMKKVRISLLALLGSVAVATAGEAQTATPSPTNTATPTVTPTRTLSITQTPRATPTAPSGATATVVATATAGTVPGKHSHVTALETTLLGTNAANPRYAADCVAANYSNPLDPSLCRCVIFTTRESGVNYLKFKCPDGAVYTVTAPTPTP